jgi:hypothetical protein
MINDFFIRNYRIVKTIRDDFVRVYLIYIIISSLSFFISFSINYRINDSLNILTFKNIFRRKIIFSENEILHAISASNHYSIYIWNFATRINYESIILYCGIRFCSAGYVNMAEKFFHKFIYGRDFFFLYIDVDASSIIFDFFMIFRILAIIIQENISHPFKF